MPAPSPVAGVSRRPSGLTLEPGAVIANRLHGDWYHLAQRPAGVITRSQALMSGNTDSSLRARVRSGRWQRLLFGVYFI